MSELTIRKMALADLPAVAALLDEAIGRGFWDPARDLDDIAIVAVENGRFVGVGTASVGSDSATAADHPVGVVRLVAVDSSARRKGVATRLVSELSAICEARGAQILLAYAWVHGPGGIAPLSSALVRSGFTFERRIEGFYGGATADACPACGLSPCVCPADVYRRGLADEGTE